MKKHIKTIVLGSLILSLSLSVISCSRDGELINTSDSRVINSSTEITEAGNTEAYSNMSQTEGIISAAEETDAPVSEETPHTIEDEHSDSDDSNIETNLSMPYDTPLEDLCKMVCDGDLPYDEIVFYPAFQDAAAWSPEKQYAAVREGKAEAGILVFDISRERVISLPRLEIQNRMRSELSETVHLYSCDLLCCEWVDDAVLKVDFDMKTGVSYYVKSNPGNYIYDLESNTVTSLEYDIVKSTLVNVDLTDDEIKAMIDANLDILLAAGDCYSEKEFIDASPDAFENIISLGDAALPYLTEIIDNHPHTHLMLQENICGVIAKFAAYAIKPSLYDQIFISPDENYILKAQVGTFFGTEWGGGRIIEYDRLSIIDNLTGNMIAETTATASDRYYGLYTNLEVNWSPDSQYVAIQSSDLHSYTSTDLFDIRRAEFITLPSADEIKQMISNQESFIGTEFVVSEWGESNVIKIDLFLRNGIACVITGNYTYDLNSKKILDINYHLEN